MDLLLEADLDKTVLNLGLFYPLLIREFIVNLTADFDDPTSIEFQKVHIRRHQFVISPTIINQFLQRNILKNVSEQCPSLWALVFELTEGA